MHRNSWTTILTSLVLILGSGCNKDDCPTGQVLYEGACVDVIPTHDGTPVCGVGTYENLGYCYADPDAVCGPNTEVVWVEDASGVQTREFYCEGQRVTDVPPCPEATVNGPICVSGWAKYLMDPDDPCGIMETIIAFGPDATAIEVAIYDPLAYATNPSTPPLGVSEVNSENGTWKVENIVVPATNFLAVVVRSIDPFTEFIFTGFPYAAAPGSNLEEVNGYGITADQNSTWSASIGDAAIAGANNCVSGDTLFDCGTWVGVFGFERDNGSINLLEGIAPRNGAGTPPPQIPISNTFYLNDTCDGFSQPTSLAESYTGSTGVIFMPGAQLGAFTGTCADLTPDSECETEQYTFDLARLGGAAPQAIFVQLEYPVGLE
jgi:hypothetical protein